jgi:hypothetical protein
LNLCSLASVSWAVDRVVSGSESMMVSAGCWLVEINQLALGVRYAVSYVVIKAPIRSSAEEM